MLANRILETFFMIDLFNFFVLKSSADNQLRIAVMLISFRPFEVASSDGR